MMRPASASSTLTFLRGLNHPVRSLKDALRETADGLVAELGISNLSPWRRTEILERLRLIQAVKSAEVRDDKGQAVHHQAATSFITKRCCSLMLMTKSD